MSRAPPAPPVSATLRGLGPLQPLPPLPLWAKPSDAVAAGFHSRAPCGFLAVRSSSSGPVRGVGSPFGSQLSNAPAPSPLQHPSIPSSWEPTPRRAPQPSQLRARGRQPALGSPGLTERRPAGQAAGPGRGALTPSGRPVPGSGQASHPASPSAAPQLPACTCPASATVAAPCSSCRLLVTPLPAARRTLSSGGTRPPPQSQGPPSSGHAALPRSADRQAHTGATSGSHGPFQALSQPLKQDRAFRKCPCDSPQ